MSEAPITRAEFAALVSIVRDLAQAFDDHSHGYNDPDSSYDSNTYGPDGNCSKVLEEIGQRLDALKEAEHA